MLWSRDGGFHDSVGFNILSILMMKKTILLMVLALAAMAQGSVTTLWVDGVSESGGWYDANKVNPNEADGDNELCWAASASNLIAWWQDKYVVDASTPNTIDDIWGVFKSSATADVGGDTGGAVQWWITGVYLPTNDEEADRSMFGLYESSTLPAFEGYYYDQYGLDFNGGFNYDTWTWENGVYDFLCPDYRNPNQVSADNLIDLVGKGCGVGLSITDDAGTFGHAITLWGIEYDDETNAISKLWLTDSDDAQHPWLNLDGLFAVDVKETDGKLYISTPGSTWYAENESIYVDGIFAIDPSVSTAWGLTAVPEPATASLSLLALAALAARRRRK